MKMNAIALFALGMFVVAFAQANAEDNTNTDQTRCDEANDITVPCMSFDSNEDFFKCALTEAKKADKTLNDIFKANNDEGKPLFQDKEMAFLYEIRLSGLVSIKMKEYVEMLVEEIALYRFEAGVQKDKLTNEDRKTLAVTQCIYSVLKEEAFRRVKGQGK